MKIRLSVFLAFGIALTVGVAGWFPSLTSGQEKAKPHIIIPEASKVSKIHFRAEDTFPGGPFELNLMKPEEIKPLITFLKDMGWDYSKSVDSKVLKVRKTPTYASITITQKDKADLGFVIGNDMILCGSRFWRIDNQKLEA